MPVAHPLVVTRDSAMRSQRPKFQTMTHEESVCSPSTEIAEEARSYRKSFSGYFSLLSWCELLAQRANIISLGVDEALKHWTRVFRQTSQI